MKKFFGFLLLCALGWFSYSYFFSSSDADKQAKHTADSIATADSLRASSPIVAIDTAKKDTLRKDTLKK